MYYIRVHCIINTAEDRIISKWNDEKKKKKIKILFDFTFYCFCVVPEVHYQCLVHYGDIGTSMMQD